MKLTKTLIVLTFLMAFAVCVSAQILNDKKFNITSKDKSEILSQVFVDGFEKLIDDKKFAQCTIPILKDEKIILIETTEPKVFPKAISDYSFKFMNAKEIEAEIKSNNGDCYFQVNTLRFENSKKARITLFRWIEVITIVDGKSWYPSRWVYASGLVYEATKNNGKWQVKFLNGTAVVS